MTERLDPHTLTHVADQLRAMKADAFDSAAALAETVIAGLDSLAAEAASRPPMMSDYIRICEESPFGPPTDTDPTLATCKFGWRLRRVWILFGGGRVCVTKGGTPGKIVADCATPAALTAALNALADKVPRG